jgi:hypothetical protein
LRFLVRLLLTPLVLAIAFPLRSAILLAIVLALVPAWRRFDAVAGHSQRL